MKKHTCQGCGEEKYLNKNGLCKKCQKLSDKGAFDTPPFLQIVNNP